MTENYPKKLNIGFCGTSERSIPIVRELFKNQNLVFCITKEPSAIGRKQIITKCIIERWCKDNNVSYVNVNSNTLKTSTKLIEQLKYSSIDLLIVADFKYILPKEIFSTPRFGSINIHFSCLPQYRGASPVQFSILNGDPKTGVTFQLMDIGMDTGDIIYQIPYSLNGTETSQYVYEQLFQLASQKISWVINEYTSGNLIPYPQDNTKATYTYSPSHPRSTYIFKEDAKINWTNNLEFIERQIRAYTPWPITWTTIEDIEKAGILKIKDNISRKMKVKIYKMKLYDITTKPEATNEATIAFSTKSKQLTNKHKILKIEELQVEGKKPMHWLDFVNGYSLPQS